MCVCVCAYVCTCVCECVRECMLVCLRCCFNDHACKCVFVCAYVCEHEGTCVHLFLVECKWHIDAHCCLDALVFFNFVYIYTITSTLPTHPNRMKSEKRENENTCYNCMNMCVCTKVSVV